MNEMLITNWNQHVGPHDMLIHVGDFALGRRDEIPKIMARLNGVKFLVQGNHDREPSIMQNLGFRYVARSMTLILCGKKIFFNHYPPQDLIIPIGYDMMVHGHTHKTTLWTAPRVFNLCVEATDYKPVLLRNLTIP